MNMGVVVWLKVMILNGLLLIVIMPKNITNGEFVVDYNKQDLVDENFKLIRAPNNDSLQSLRGQNFKLPNQFFIENIRTGEFTQISENYMMESVKDTNDQQKFTTNSFDTEMELLFVSLQEQLNKITTFFQGLFAGMALLYCITLNLSVSVSSDLVRVQDQALRIVAMLSSFGGMYSFLISKQKYDFIKIRGTSSQIDKVYKSLVLCTIEMVFYAVSYVIFNVSHTYAVQYNIAATSYSQLTQSTTAYTALCLVGWIFTNLNTYKYQH